MEPTWELAAAERLVGDRARSTAPAERRAAAIRFVQNAREFGIDLSLFWATIEEGAVAGPASALPGGPVVRQVCLAVVGSGRTANLFVSSGVPGGKRDHGARAAAHAERVGLLEAACTAIGSAGPRTGRGARLGQGLLEATETDAAAAMRDAGFTRLGELAYLRRRMPSGKDWQGAAVLEGFELVAMPELSGAEAVLSGVLERSYIETLDCPELAGLRDVSDVLDSHKAVGVYDPNLWWVLRSREPIGGERHHGCVLLSACPEQDSVELVYLGLAPAVRRRGLGASLLARALDRLAGRGERWVTCAVDTRNAPAMALYERAGFSPFSSRIPFVRRLGAPA
ncbi:MAG: GNAT family N-acetyltransferase [Phycisphaeraceae bacterium]|nr:GNAT family N-acetyltransferase [Phycisphaeraceae bacterium]